MQVEVTGSGVAAQVSVSSVHPASVVEVVDVVVVVEVEVVVVETVVVVVVSVVLCVPQPTKTGTKSKISQNIFFTLGNYTSIYLIVQEL